MYNKKLVEHSNNTLKSQSLWVLTLICLTMFFLFLGETSFYSRGEPREALVGAAMIQQNNWILPITNGVDIAYKPPLFHWCVALCSTVVGSVTEYTSRMPSALALTFMVLGGFSFYARRKGASIALITALLTLTNFEIHRAGVAARVDMLLTALMVGALFLLYRWYERSMKGVPWLAILCMSGAFLTKGPVGMVLPCLIMFIFCWIKGFPFLQITWKYLLVGLASCVLPACWYYAAWQQGGDAFYQLFLEENVYRFLGKMSYQSHVHSAPYNFLMLFLGFIPYTILVVVSLFFLRYDSCKEIMKKPRTWWERFKTSIQHMDDVRLFTLLGAVVTVLFYCIPSSKRGVYLMPAYPFIAYFLAEYVVYIQQSYPKSIKIFNNILIGLVITLFAAFLIIRTGLIPDTVFSGKHALENLSYKHALEDIPLNFWRILVVLLPVLATLYIVVCRKKKMHSLLFSTFLLIISIFIALDGFYQPTILNVKSNKAVAMHIRDIVPEGKIYSYITLTDMNNRMHPFSIDFYLNGRVIPFIESAPVKGYLLLGEKEYDGFIQRYGSTYEIREIYNPHHRSCDERDMIHLYQFKQKQRL